MIRVICDEKINKVLLRNKYWIKVIC